MIREPQCSIRRCKHFIGVHQPSGNESNEYVYCRAFPRGIPDEIAYGSNKHLAVHPDQLNEIIYEKE